MAEKTLTLQEQNAKVRQIESRLRDRLGPLGDKVMRLLDQVDPHRLLVFAQAREIEHLEARNVALGMIVAHVEVVRDQVLHEFARIEVEGVKVDPEVWHAVRTCVVDRRGGREDGTED